jgi:hypothetical protein
LQVFAIEQIERKLSMLYSTHNTKPGGTPLSEVGKYWVSPRLPKKKKAKIAKRAFDQKALSGTPMDATASAVIAAGKKRRNEV